MASANEFIGLAVDPVALGSTRDLLGGSPSWATPTIWLPVETAQVTPGYRNLDRNNEVRNQRGQVPEVAFQADPSLTFTVKMYPSLMKFLFPKGLGGTIVATGTSPAAITSKIPVGSVQLGAMQAIVVRDTQTDRMSGVVISSMDINVPTDGDATVTFNCDALFHKHYVTSSPPTPAYVTENPYSTVTLKTMLGAALTVVQCATSLTLTYDNQLKSDADLRFCKGANIEVATAGTPPVYQRRQYPGRYALGDQKLTGQIGFSTVRTDMEDLQRVAQANKLVWELTQDPINPATTPAADELMRITVPAGQIDGGGASALVNDSVPNSSYNFSGYIDPASGASFFVEFVTSAAVS